MSDRFVNHSDLEGLKKMIHDLDKRQTVLERDLQNVSLTLPTILNKLDSLPEKLNEQVGKTLKSEIAAHKTQCRLDGLNGNGDKSFLQWIVKNQLQILLILALIAATYFKVIIP